MHIPSPSSKLGLLQDSEGDAVVAGAVVEGSGLGIVEAAGGTSVKVVGQALPGPPAGVIVVVNAPW